MSAAATAMPLPGSAIAENDYLRFLLGDQVLAVELAAVSEIVAFEEPTPVPGTPDWILGVINLRGRVLPVIDIAMKLGVPSLEQSRRTALLVMEVDVQDVHLSIAVRIDYLKDIISIERDAIDPPPEFGVDIRVEYLRGLWRDPEAKNVLRIVDVVKMFTNEELLEASLSEAKRKREEQAAKLAAKKAAAKKRPPPLPKLAPPKTDVQEVPEGTSELEEGIFVFD